VNMPLAAAIVVGLKFVDWLSTLAGLHFGLREGNPLYAAALHAGGVAAMTVLVVALTYIMCYMLSKAGPARPIGVLLIAMPTLAVILNNLWLIS